MTGSRQGQTMGGLTAARLRLACCCAMGCLCVAGCHHKQVQPIVLPQQTPVALEPVHPTDQPPLIETPKPKLPPVPVAEAASTPKQKKKRTKPAAVATPPPAAPAEPPAQSAAAAESSPESTAIGALTPGGELSPKTQQEASELIASNDKRLAALPDAKLKAQHSLVSKVRNFQRQAQQAMRSGDADGAKTLATKAKLLLDDLEKEGEGS